MTDVTNDIVENYQFSLKNYQKNFQSKHWSYNNDKKKVLFNKNKLQNFRQNGLSTGMDDSFYKKKKKS